MRGKNEEMTLEQTIEGWCPNCGEKTEFDYIGKQKYSGVEFDMYNCKLCIGTLSENTIKLYSKKRKEMEDKI